MRKQTVVSLFAGIGGFDLGFTRAGFEIVAHVEKDANCRKLLAAKWPAAVALDDVCTAGAHNLPPCDVIVGGSPCQSFSVAGLRKGLNDPRGNLLLQYLRVVSELRPNWMLWENVPGVLSDKTKALNNMLDALAELGYIVDVEIIDAQWNGVAQRRRRVFVCGRSVESLASEMTSTSALIIAQCLTEILHGILAGMLVASGAVPSESVSPALSNDGLNRRIRLFRLHGETDSLWQTWRNCLDAAYQKSAQEPGNSNAVLGENQTTCTEEGQLSGVETERHTTPTGPSWNESLAAAFDLVKSYTTSTGTSLTTNETIFMCSWAALHIARLIARLNTSCPPFFAAASSSLTAMKEYIGYARHTSSDLFGDTSGIRNWMDFVRQAEQASDALGSIGVECFGTVLSLQESLCGHPTPRRETGQGVAGCIESRTTGGGFPGTDGACSGHVVSCPLTSNPYGDHESRESMLIPAVAGCPSPGAHPGGCDGQAGNTPGHLVPCYGIDEEQNAAENLMGCLKARKEGGGFEAAVAFAQNTRDELREMEVVGALAAEPGMKQTSYLRQSMQVRRLTPTECERLQGFPDSWTADFSDSTRYKMLGNAVCVNVAEWIARRLENPT